MLKLFGRTFAQPLANLANPHSEKYFFVILDIFSTKVWVRHSQGFLVRHTTRYRNYAFLWPTMRNATHFYPGSVRSVLRIKIGNVMKAAYSTSCFSNDSDVRMLSGSS